MKKTTSKSILINGIYTTDVFRDRIQVIAHTGGTSYVLQYWSTGLTFDAKGVRINRRGNIVWKEAKHLRYDFFPEVLA